MGIINLSFKQKSSWVSPTKIGAQWFFEWRDIGPIWIWRWVSLKLGDSSAKWWGFLESGSRDIIRPLMTFLHRFFGDEKFIDDGYFPAFFQHFYDAFQIEIRNLSPKSRDETNQRLCSFSAGETPTVGEITKYAASWSSWNILGQMIVVEYGWSNSDDHRWQQRYHV